MQTDGAPELVRKEEEATTRKAMEKRWWSESLSDGGPTGQVPMIDAKRRSMGRRGAVTRGPRDNEGKPTGSQLAANWQPTGSQLAAKL